ncbi:PEP/pyruvate-binding domain-containing protein [Neosynechococcus sphagnicola]|uniref:PEP/pyruvate-binding domain-containing protein n=1 Tax=Neosynechococcus sphagnicola TaxID=1501145 RepID=UPI000A8C63AE|nr:PEP/pyruvate-binding domain-containing protein [Neosynechococcus sphagnicola]
MAGTLAVLSEAFKGIATVLLARQFFPLDPTWELIALMALVTGRYWMGRGAGTTNVVWGYLVYDPVVAGLTFVIGGIGFTILRERHQGRWGVLVLFPLLTALRHPQDLSQIGAAIALAVLMAWIYQHIPDDLDLEPSQGQPSSQGMFHFFRGDGQRPASGHRALVSLDQPLTPHRVGAKAATLAQLRRRGYPVPAGWVIPPGDDPEPLMGFLQPSRQRPLVVRSSTIGEDSEVASAAGQYTTVLNVTNTPALEAAIGRCLASYDQPAAIQYRRDRHLPEDAMAILIQQQVEAVFSGVAFSRDPIACQGDAVVIEALPGAASQVVSGKVTPECYRVYIPEGEIRPQSSWLLPEERALPLEGAGDLPPRLIQQVAYLARHLEVHYHGIPQDIEWSFDGQTLWLLQSRPITTLLPIWTRKIAAEVIPGAIRPLTWSINQPLTCGVWGELFTVVLGKRAQDLTFAATATLHDSHAYFNASLLGQIFRRMGLPPESLEFLTRGAKFSRPPLLVTLGNLPGLLRLLGRELQLVKDFQRQDRHQFQPTLAALAAQPATDLNVDALIARIETLLALLKRATYFSILAPLSVALRQALIRAPETALDQGQTPEVAALRSLQALADQARPLLTHLSTTPVQTETGLQALGTTALGLHLLDQLHQLLQAYGYLSPVGTDIAIPTWKEDPAIALDLFVQLCLAPRPPVPIPTETTGLSATAKTGRSQRAGDRCLQSFVGRITLELSRPRATLASSGAVREAGGYFLPGVGRDPTGGHR